MSNEEKIQQVQFAVIDLNSLVSDEDRREENESVNVALLQGHFGQARILIPDSEYGIELATSLAELSEKLLELYATKVLH